MYEGEPQEVELLCDKELMKRMIDKFGRRTGMMKNCNCEYDEG